MYVRDITIPTEMFLMSVGKSSASKMFSIGRMPRGSKAGGIIAVIRNNQSIVVLNGLPSVVSFNWLHIPTAKK